MREFDNFEKWVIATIANSENNQSVGTLLKNTFPHFVFIMQQDGMKMYTTDEYDVKDHICIYDKLVAVIVLLEYMEKEFLIRLHHACPVAPLQEDMPDDWVTMVPVNDEKILDLLSEKWNNLIFCSSALRSFVIRGYRTTEEVHFRKQFAATWVGIVLALLLGIISLFDKCQFQDLYN